MTIDLSAYKPTPETGGDANAIANAFTAIETILNGGIDASAFAAGKILDPLKLTQDGAVPGQSLVWSAAANGGMGGWVPASMGVYRKTTAKQIVNTVAETDLLNGEITVAAGVMGATGMLRLTAFGDHVNNSGGNIGSPRFKLKLGATTLLDTNVLAGVIGTAVQRWPWYLKAEILNTAAGAQIVLLKVRIVFSNAGVSGGAAFTVGEGALQTVLATATATDIIDGDGFNAAAIDTTAANLLTLTVTNAVANANVDVTLKGAVVEIL